MSCRGRALSSTPARTPAQNFGSARGGWKDKDALGGKSQVSAQHFTRAHLSLSQRNSAVAGILHAGMPLRARDGIFLHSVYGINA